MSNKIKKHTGDILTLTRGILVQGCNAQGVMGSGIAKSIRDKWPDVFDVYRASWPNHIGLGSVTYCKGTNYWPHKHSWSVGLSDQLPPSLIVANAVTQEFYGRDPSVVYASYDAIAACFAVIRIEAMRTGLPVHFPLIGCGQAHGDWLQVEDIIMDALGPNIEKHLWVLP